MTAARPAPDASPWPPTQAADAPAGPPGGAGVDSGTTVTGSAPPRSQVTMAQDMPRDVPRGEDGGEDKGDGEDGGQGGRDRRSVWRHLCADGCNCRPV